MRATIAAILLLLAGCQAGADRPNLASKSDTLRLFDPMPDTVLASPFDWFKNCIALRRGRGMVVANGIQREVEPQAPLEKLIQAYADSLKRRKLYILCDSSIATATIVTVIGHLKDEGIKNYKVVRMDTVLPSAKPIIVAPSTLYNDKTAKPDSSVLILTVVDKGFKIEHLNQTQIVSGLKELENYLRQHRSSIDGGRAVIAAKASAPFNQIMPLVKLLKEYRCATSLSVQTER